MSYILTYHSHHVLGPEYDLNDHIALPIDLELITHAGYQIVSLEKIVAMLLDHQQGCPKNGGSDDSRYVALTFDDGPIFDLDDFVHPQIGLQRGFAGTMADFADTKLGGLQPELTATSFVIASPEARRVIESTFDAAYTYLNAGSMDDSWWARAIRTGLLSIGNHSWDHLHPALPSVAHSTQARADFKQVKSYEDADAQILAAARFIHERTSGHAVPYFAYPFGHYNDFLTTEYFPQRHEGIGVRAAFTAEPKPITGTESLWSLPRYVCGHDWKTPSALLAILRE
jgi:peptidoglycan/xylan/chitin deacetylase (PgdA/CDA1 family)